MFKGNVALAGPLPQGQLLAEPGWPGGEVSGGRPPAPSTAHGLREPWQGERRAAQGEAASFSTAPSLDKAGDFLGSRTVLGISGEIRGKAAIPCALSSRAALTQWVAFTQWVPLQPREVPPSSFAWEKMNDSLNLC